MRGGAPIKKSGASQACAPVGCSDPAPPKISPARSDPPVGSSTALHCKVGETRTRVGKTVQTTSLPVAGPLTKHGFFLRKEKFATTYILASTIDRPAGCVTAFNERRLPGGEAHFLVCRFHHSTACTFDHTGVAYLRHSAFPPPLGVVENTKPNTTQVTVSVLY